MSHFLVLPKLQGPPLPANCRTAAQESAPDAKYLEQPASHKANHNSTMKPPEIKTEVSYKLFYNARVTNLHLTDFKSGRPTSLLNNADRGR